MRLSPPTLSPSENTNEASSTGGANTSEVDEVKNDEHQQLAHASAALEDEKDKSVIVHETEINLARLNKKIGKRINIIDTLLERLSLRVNPKVYFFFGHTGVGMWIDFSY
jgi:hypothetical protein